MLGLAERRSMPPSRQIPTIIRPDMANRQTSETSGATTPSCSDSGYQLVDQPKTTAM